MAEPEISAGQDRAQAVAWFLSSEKTIAEIAQALNLPESRVREWVWNASPEDASDNAHPAEAAPAQAETAAPEAAVVEAVQRAELMAAEAIARAELVAAGARAEAAEARAQLEATRAELEAARAEIARHAAAEAAAREEMRAVYAEAVEAISRIEATADERVARAEAAATAAVTSADRPGAQATAADATTQADQTDNAGAGAAEATPAPAAEPAMAAADVKPRTVDRSQDEAEARAKIAEVMRRAAPVELWVHATGRTLEAARAEVLDRLGVDEAQAEIEVLSEGSRWLPGRVQVRGRVRVVPHRNA